MTVDAPRNSKRAPFRGDHVGSLLRPPALLAARERHRRGEIGDRELRDVEDDAIRKVVKQQEETGLQGVTDGEFRRTFFHVDFLKAIAGVVESPGRYTLKFKTTESELEFTPPVLGVRGRLGSGGALSTADFSFLRQVATKTPKLCIPSPSMLHFRGGRDEIDSAAYPEMEEFFHDLARVYREEVDGLYAAGCRYLQLDDTNLAYLCDEEHRERVRQIGEDPDQLPAVYARLLSDSLRHRPDDMAACIHLCRGNFRSSWVAEGGYDQVAETLFNEIDVDAFFLEYDDERSGGFEPLRFVPPEKTVVLGLVTSKRPELEPADLVKRRIDEASRYVPLERLALSPQCGFSSTAEGNALTEAEQFAKLRHVVQIAHEVWG